MTHGEKIAEGAPWRKEEDADSNLAPSQATDGSTEGKGGGQPGEAGGMGESKGKSVVSVGDKEFRGDRHWQDRRHSCTRR
jgi:hypothetical protein